LIQACIVQARMGSTRLPGKIMMPLGDTTVLGQVLRRCASIPGIDVVVCATGTVAADDRVCDEAARHGALVHRGSPDDVLARYHGAARQVGADVVMRVTSDCPLIDPAVCGAVLALRREARADYAANNMPPSFPHGLDCEAFTAAALARAMAEARDPHDREHVTPWLRREVGLLRVNLDGPGGDLVHRRWTLDYPEDFDFFTAVFAALDDAATAGWREVLALVEARPEIAALNAVRAQR
jgi:spore coat polysaccharide biosynthesis protein SpsF